jgi:hypothetical protein
MRLMPRFFLLLPIVLMCYSPLPSWAATNDNGSETSAPIREENGGQVYVTHIAGVEYRIPVPYFRYLLSKPKAHAEQMLINAALPDMHEISVGSPESPESRGGAWGPMANILIRDARSTTSFAFRLGVIQKIEGPLQPRGEEYGLHAFVGSKGFFGHLGADMAPVFSGGKVVKSPTPEQTKGMFDEMYTDAESDKASMYITCSGNSAVPFPHCTEVFADNGLLYEVSYDKGHLSEWPSIEEATIKMMKRFAHPNTSG